MIPISTEDLKTDFEFESESSKTYKLNIQESTISGSADDLEAMKQAIWLILNTERYEHLIYSWNYGIELMDLYGQPIPFVLPELKRRITEALIQDDRITGVDDFVFEKKTDVIHVRFTVTTTFGQIEAERAVTV